MEPNNEFMLSLRNCNSEMRTVMFCNRPSVSDKRENILERLAVISEKREIELLAICIDSPIWDLRLWREI